MRAAVSLSVSIAVIVTPATAVPLKLSAVPASVSAPASGVAPSVAIEPVTALTLAVAPAPAPKDVVECAGKAFVARERLAFVAQERPAVVAQERPAVVAQWMLAVVAQWMLAVVAARHCFVAVPIRKQPAATAQLVVSRELVLSRDLVVTSALALLLFLFVVLLLLLLVALLPLRRGQPVPAPSRRAPPHALLDLARNLLTRLWSRGGKKGERRRSGRGLRLGNGDGLVDSVVDDRSIVGHDEEIKKKCDPRAHPRAPSVSQRYYTLKDESLVYVKGFHVFGRAFPPVFLLRAPEMQAPGDSELVRSLVDAFEASGAAPGLRAAVLALVLSAEGSIAAPARAGSGPDALLASSLVADFLRTSGYDAALAVFEAEQALGRVAAGPAGEAANVIADSVIASAASAASLALGVEGAEGLVTSGRSASSANGGAPRFLAREVVAEELGLDGETASSEPTLESLVRRAREARVAKVTSARSWVQSMKAEAEDAADARSGAGGRVFSALRPDSLAPNPSPITIVNVD